jgi:hypothetical protein
MKDVKLRDQPAILNSMIEALGQASGGCSQLLHHKKDPRWLIMRNGIDLARDAAINMATFQAQKITAIKS